VSEVSLATATSPQDIEAVKELVVEYAKTLPSDLGYQDFDGELSSFPGKYAPPKGCLLLAHVQGEAADSVALRPLEDNIGEVKRLYVRPGFRGYGLSRRLVGDIVAFGRAAGVTRLCVSIQYAG
jgi:GNAT superfamily N-acetyltransferase